MDGMDRYVHQTASHCEEAMFKCWALLFLFGHVATVFCSSRGQKIVHLELEVDSLSVKKKTWTQMSHLVFLNVAVDPLTNQKVENLEPSIMMDKNGSEPSTIQVIDLQLMCIQWSQGFVLSRLVVNSWWLIVDDHFDHTSKHMMHLGCFSKSQFFKPYVQST